MKRYPYNTVRTYVENGGGFCPECDHDEPMHSRPMMDDSSVIIVDYHCPACKAEWKSIYQIDDLEHVTDGIHHNQQQLFKPTG